MIRSLFFFLAFLCTLTTTQTVSAQSFPVNITASISSPYTPYLVDYTEPASQKLMVNILLRDHTVPEYSCKFRLTIEGVGITIRTKSYFMPPPTQIQGGVPTILYGEDLAEYFNPANLDFSGISKGDYTRGAKLPEGVYRFTLEVLDYHRGTVVSNKGTATAWIILNDPPILNLVRNNAKVAIVDPVNIAFNWTPRHTGSPNAAFTTEYGFKLVEVWPATRNPYDAVLSQPPLYETTTSFTQIVYGPSEPALIPGRKYAWQVQAKDTEGKDLFKNEGKSEVYVFQFGDAIGVPQNFRRDDGSNTSVLLLKWEPAPDGAIPEQYRVRYRQKGDTRGVWYESVTPQRWVAVPDLQRDTEYEMQVRAEATLQYSEYSQLVAFKTDANDKDGFECGKEDEDVPITSTQLLTALHWGDTITCGAFKLLVRKATGANGTFTGDGYLKVSLLHGAGVHCSFSGQINSNYQMISGGWESIYTPGGPAAQLIEDAMKIGEEPSSAAKDTTANQTPDYTIPGTIDSIYVNRKGKIVVIDTEGNQSTYEQKKEDGRKDKAKDTIIADAAGNSYTVGADGTISKKASGAGQPNSQPLANYIGTKEATLVAEIIKRFNTQLAAKITAVREPVFPRGAGPMADIFSSAASCMPDNQEQLKIIKAYTDKANEDKNLLNALIAKIFKNASDKDIITELIKVDIKEGQQFADVLTQEQLQKAEDVLCPYVTDAAKQEFLESWWRAPYWERAAKILKEQFEDQGIYDDVYLVCGESECKTVAILKISEEASVTTEVTFSSQQSPADIFRILHDSYKVDFLEARDVTLESFGEWFWNYMAIKDDKLYHGTSWEAKSLVFFADMLMATPGTIEGWITGKHWRTGEELAMWEQMLGILDVIPAEALAKAGVTAMVIKIGSKVIDISKLAQPVKNFITTAYKSGLKLIIKSKDEILIFAGAGKKQIGRFFNGVLQDLYWKYGGERILAKLANVKYLDDNTKQVVEGTLEIVEEGSEIGIRVATAINRLIRSIDDFKASIAKGENVFYVGKHSDIKPRPTGINGIAESHHGVNSVWMKEKYIDYVADNAPSVYMLKSPNHNSTRAEFNRWAAEMRTKQGLSKVDYTKITTEDILLLANRQFDAADVPQNVRDEYFKLWNEYIKTLMIK